MIRLPSARGLLLARIALGSAGALLAIPAVAIALSIGTGGPLDPVASQSREVLRGLGQTADALDRAETSLGSAVASLRNGTASANDAAEMTAALGSAMSELAGAASAQVLGVQPFAALAPRFDELASRSATLAGSLRGTGASLDTTRRDLEGLRGRVTELAATVRGIGPTGSPGGGSLGLTRAILALLAGWVGAGAAISAAEATRSLRRTRTP